MKGKVKLDVSAADVTVNGHGRRSSTPSSAATCPPRCNRSVSRSAERRSAPSAVPRPTQGETFKYHVQRKNKCQAGGSSKATGFPSFSLTSHHETPAGVEAGSIRIPIFFFSMSSYASYLQFRGNREFLLQFLRIRHLTGDFQCLFITVWRPQPSDCVC